MQSTFKDKNGKAFVVIVNLNGEEDTKECVDSVLSQTYKNFEVLVIDNGSEEDKYQKLKKLLPSVKILRNEKNVGFTGGFNKGIEYVKSNNGDYVVLLNNDTVVDKNWLEELIITARKDSKIGIVGSKSYFFSEKDTIQSAGLGYKNSNYFDRGRGEKDHGQYDREEEVSAVSGVSMLINLKMPEKLIYLDESLFAYYEDVEICLRCRSAGYKVVYNPKSVLWHKVSKTATTMKGFQTYYGVRNRLRILKRYNGFNVFFIAYLRSIVRAFVNLFSFNKDLIFNYFRALRDV